MGVKRANGEGSVYVDGQGRVVAAFPYTDPVTGERRRRRLCAKSKTEARAKMRAEMDRVAAGSPPADARESVASWSRRWRTSSLVASDRAHNTKTQYATLARVHIESGVFGAKTLDRVRPSDVEALRTVLRDKGLSTLTIRTVDTVLRLILDAAVRDGLLGRNPATAVRRPRKEHKEAQHLDRADVVRVLEALRPTRYYAPTFLIAMTGMRRGEALALRWSDVDFDAALIHVRGTLNRVAGE